MPKPTDALDRIRVATPCSADWNEMMGNDQVRFCQHCSKHVHDLSKFTRKEAMKLVAASEGKLCVRYQKRPDGTLHTAERAAPLTQIKRRLSRIAAGAFTASLTLASNAAAQSARPTGGNQPVVVQPASAVTLGRVLVHVGQTASLSGTVFDPERAGIVAARVSLVNEATRLAETVSSDYTGAYQFQALEAGVYTLRVEAIGFPAFEQKGLVVRDGARERVDVTLQHWTIMGDMTIVLPSTPLVRAVWEGNLREVKNLLAQGVDVNAVDEGAGNTALATAVSNGQLEFVQTLLAARADPNVRNQGGRTALMNLDGDASLEIVRALLAAWADVNIEDVDENTALHSAAPTAKSEVLRALLDAGASVNAVNNLGQTALMEAAAYGNVENVKALLLAGADPHLKNKGGQTALSFAQEHNQQEVIALLQSYEAYE
ncbi:MAG TPA: ankyrin repeat domain-containing protein [Pyrinomonadaceae bacterium]|nr:ankyrin repeat domain-containing protein [Pyrinomonadaceae bacterium]